MTRVRSIRVSAVSERLRCLALVVPLVVAAGSGAFGADPGFNPMPAEGDLVLPVPGGGEMVFRAVAVAEGETLFPVREFKMGDRTEGGWQEYPTDAAVGGAFQEKSGGAWVYYLGKYEVSEAQYYAVAEGGTGEQKASNYPARNLSWYDCLNFVNRYNLWLFANALEEVPAQGGRHGYLRLPTEVEWEFAARGGLGVEEHEFDRKNVYGPELVRHEWYSGPESSHNKVKRIGILKPNPLGIHDMLGNVSEMTSSLYAVEYYQGRTGGFVARGGDFFTPKAEMRSSMRTEQPFYNREYGPSRQETLGFRLALVSQIFTSSAETSRMRDEWPDYRQTRMVPTLPAAGAVANSAKATRRIEDIRGHLEALKSGVREGEVAGEEAVAKLGLLDAAIGDVESLIFKAEKDSAAAWVKIGSNTGYLLARELSKLTQSERLMKLIAETGSEEEVKRDEARHGRLVLNIADAKIQYADAIQELGRLEKSAVLDAFEDYKKRVADLNIAEQGRSIGITQGHVVNYFETQRLDMEVYEEELKQLR